MTWSEALESSIKNWRKRAKGITVDEDCPLCTKDNFVGERGCDFCPAKTTTICSEMFGEWEGFEYDRDPRSKKVAKQIVNALIKLRPKVSRSHKGKVK
jgi:hypothetical protein